jgi:hypothetical protein
MQVLFQPSNAIHRERESLRSVYEQVPMIASTTREADFAACVYHQKMIITTILRVVITTLLIIIKKIAQKKSVLIVPYLIFPSSPTRCCILLTFTGDRK